MIPGISSLFLVSFNEIRQIDVAGDTIGIGRIGRHGSFARSGIKGPTYTLDEIVYFMNGQGEIN